MAVQRAKDVFISYGREEGVREFVKQLKVDLEANGVSVWLDADDIPTGSDFHIEIGVALKSCRALIPVLTKKYVKSRYCKGELYVANGENKVLLPVIYEDGWDEGEEGAGVNYIVAAYNWAFFRPSMDDHKTSLDKLVHGIKLKLQDGSEKPVATQKGSESLGMSMALAVKDIKRWQELGHQLDISPEKLLELLNSGQSGAECRDEMVAYWEKHDNDASWEKLARALARMGENKLAEKIIEEHVKKTSTPSVQLLPQEVELKTNKRSLYNRYGKEGVKSGAGGTGEHDSSILTMVIILIAVFCAIFAWWYVGPAHGTAYQSFHSSGNSLFSEDVMNLYREDNEIQEVNDLIQAVKKIGDWQGLCTNLGVSEGKIDALVHSTATVDAKKADCLRAYLYEGEANWSHVVKALVMHPVSIK